MESGDLDISLTMALQILRIKAKEDIRKFRTTSFVTFCMRVELHGLFSLNNMLVIPGASSDRD